MRYPVASGLPTGKSKPSASLVTASFGSASAAAAMKPRVTRKNDFLRMEDGSKRDQDTWQAFPDKIGKIFALFYKIETRCGVQSPGLWPSLGASDGVTRRSPSPWRQT